MLWMGMGGHRSLLMVMVWVWIQIRRQMLGSASYPPNYGPPPDVVCCVGECGGVQCTHGLLLPLPASSGQDKAAVLCPPFGQSKPSQAKPLKEATKVASCT